MLTPENLKLSLAMVVCLVIGWTGPSVAHGVHAKFAHNADKVDGKHAVGAGAGLAKARGKLVAHNATGKLPAKFIPKVRDANRLDGLDSTVFSRRTAKPGDVMTGGYNVMGANGYMGNFVTFPSHLRSNIPAAGVHFLASGQPTASCPGPGKAAPGHLCVYEASGFDRGWGAFTISDPATKAKGAHRSGFALYFDALAAQSWSYGTWAVKAPAA